MEKLVVLRPLGRMMPEWGKDMIGFDETMLNFAKIKVAGVGGGGSNAVNRMMDMGLSADFIVMNTDAQAVQSSPANQRLQLGDKVTKGLGAGANPGVGEQAALESRADILKALDGADMVFVTAGMGGGTGTGAAPIVAQCAREVGALTVGVVTYPFSFEGKRRMVKAEQGVAKLREHVDTLITISNDRLLKIASRQTSLLDAFCMADDVLKQGVHSIAGLISKPAMINLDFADVQSVMSSSGQAFMGIGMGKGEDRAMDAMQKAMHSPLLGISVEGARAVLVNVTGSQDMSLLEVNEAVGILMDAVDEDANIIFGADIDETMGDDVRITIIATRFGAEAGPAASVKAPEAKTDFSLSGGMEIPQFMRRG